MHNQAVEHNVAVFSVLSFALRRRLKLKHTWQLTACLLQIINSSLPTSSTISITTVGTERLRASGR